MQQQSPTDAQAQWMQQQDVKTLWVGDLQPWMDESYLTSTFCSTGELISAKVIRNKTTGVSDGYGFVEFQTHACAERVLQSYNGTRMPRAELPFRLNWAYFGVGDRRPEGATESSIFVGDLAPDVTDFMLQETFRSRYASILGAKVVTDPATSRSKGYGFVRFADDNERVRAMTEMNGVYCSSRPMRINAATPKKAPSLTPPTPKTPIYPPLQNVPTDNDPTNTTIFVGGLDPAVTEEELTKIFGEFGELIYVKIPPGKGCGFVQFTHRPCAEEALGRLHGTMIGQQAIRLSWGRTASKQPWVQPSDQQWSSYYGYNYEAYAYPQAQDATGYSSYTNYYPTYGAYNAQYGTPIYEEVFDPLAPVDVDTLNAIHMSMNEPIFFSRLRRQREQAQV